MPKRLAFSQRQPDPTFVRSFIVSHTTHPVLQLAMGRDKCDLWLAEMRTLEKAIHDSAIGLNYMAVLMGAFGAIALVLSAIGVYGVTA